jgi:hypothetical protein
MKKVFAATGLILLLAGVLLGLIPQSLHVPANPGSQLPPNASASMKVLAGPSPAYDVYCGAPWSRAAACDFGARPQLAVLSLALGGIALLAGLVVTVQQNQQEPPKP